MVRVRAIERTASAAQIAAEPETRVTRLDWRAWSVALGVAAVVAAYGLRLLEGSLMYGLIEPRLPGPEVLASWLAAPRVTLLMATGLALYLLGIAWTPREHPEQKENLT